MESATIEQAVAKTDALLAKSQDHGLIDIRKQLVNLQRGQTQHSIERIIAYNYTPAPTAELQNWADTVLAALRGSNEDVRTTGG